jgi:hypothetical protein
MIFGIQHDRIVRAGSTWSTSALQTAMKRAIERHNMTRLTPVGADQASRALAHR